MYRVFSSRVVLAALLGSALLWSACTSADGRAPDASGETAAPLPVAPVAAVEQPIARFINATGSLTAEDQADVAAETGGRVVETPVERGTVVAAGTELVRLSAAETEAQLREAEANAAQIEARLGIGPSGGFDADVVPEVLTARASFDLATSEFARIQSLLDQRVVSQSEFDQRRTQLEAARRQYEVSRNAAAQQYQALQAARARVTLARKALADTVVRAPFAGVVAERTVSVGDYVTRGTRVAVVVRVDPLRVRLTIPEQFIRAIFVGQTVSFEVDAYPGRQFQGQVRYVSPALETAQRALTVEAVVANGTRELKPGLFATARLEQPARTPAILVPASAVQTTAGTSRVFVVDGSLVQERIVTVGQTLDDLVELTNGLKPGERVATANVAQLTDGTRIQM
jgi:RND family efflux transporter MFP subunit